MDLYLMKLDNVRKYLKVFSFEKTSPQTDQGRFVVNKLSIEEIELLLTQIMLNSLTLNRVHVLMISVKKDVNGT